MIKDMKQKGMNMTQIANELGRDRKTIRRWMEEGCLNGTVILDEVRDRGYTGGATLLRDFMRPLRPIIQAEL